MVFIPRWERYRDKKPSGAVDLDWNNELTEWLDLYVDFGESTKPRDLVKNTAITGSDRSIRELDGCIGNDFYGNNYSINSYSIPVGDVTFVCDFAIDSLASGTSQDAVRHIVNTRVADNPSGIEITASNNWASNKPNVSDFSGTATVSFFIDGKQQSGNIADNLLQINKKYTFIVVFRNLSLPGDIFEIGAKQDIPFYFDGVIGSVSVFRKALDSAAIYEISEAPYQILKPRRRWFVFGSGTGGLLLFLSDISQTNAIDSLALVQQNNIIANDLSQSVNVDNVALTQQNNLLLNNLANDVTVDNVTLSQQNAIIADNIVQSSVFEIIAITQQNNIVVSDMSQSSTVDNISLNVGGSIAVNNISHSNTIDNVAITQAGNLIVADVNQSNSADNIALMQASVLSIDSVLNNITVDNIALDFSVILDVNNANQSISIDNIVVTQAGSLSIAGLLHNSTIDNIALTQQSTLIVSDMLHDMLLDNINLIDGTISLQTNIGTVFMLKSEHNIFMKGESSPVFVIRG